MIPFAKVEIPKSVISKCIDVLDSGNISNGEYVKEFEELISKISKTDYAVCTNSGTSALMISSKYVLKGQVGTQSYTWVSPKEVILRYGFVPIWLDVDIGTWVVEKSNLEMADSYLLTDTFGNKTNVTTRKPTLIDCAHSFGLPFNQKYQAGIFSFAPAKTFTAGEGGAIITNDKKLYKQLKEEVKWAGRMQEINAIIGLHNAKQYKKTLKQKKKIFDYYKLKLAGYFDFQKIKKSNYNVVGCYTCPTNSFSLIKKLKNKIELKKRYIVEHNLNISNQLYKENICLPSYPNVDYKKVTELLLEVLE